METKQSLLNSILENQPSLIVFSLDTAYRYTFFSIGHARRMSERMVEPITIGSDFFDLVKNPSNKAKLKSNFDRALQGETFTIEESFNSKGKEIAFDNHYSPVRDNDGKIIGVSVFAYETTAIKQAEQERIGIESSYQTLLENSTDAIYIMRADGPDIGKIVSANRSAARMHGFTYEEFLQLNIKEIDTPETGALFDDRMDKLVHGEKLSFEVTHRRKDGSVFPLAVSACALSIGGKMHMLSINRDITEHEEIVEAVKDRERFIQTIATASPDLIYVMDHEHNGKVIYSNRRMGDELGYTTQELEEMYKIFPTPHLHPDDVRLAAENAKRWETAADNEILETQFRIKNKAGEWRWYTSRETVFKRDKNGKVIQVVGTSRDRTESKKSGLALKQSEERFKRLQEASFGGIGVHDEGKIIDANHGLAAITGFSVDELIGMDGLQLIAPEFREHVIQKIRVGYELPYDVIGVRKDGSRYHLEVQAKNIPYENKMVRVTEFRDITERKQIEEAIREQNVRLAGIAETLTRKNEQLEEFTQIVSHNLRAPVGNIVTLLSLYESAEKNEQEEYIRYLHNSSATLLSTLNELNEVLKVKQNKNIELQELEFAVVFERVCQMLSGSISELGAEIHRDFTEAPIVQYPNIYLESIILNLMSNALKYHDRKRTLVIKVRTYRDGRQIALEVADNGLGINLQLYGHQLFKMRKTFHEHPESRGLGLFLIKNQIESMGGEISVKSEVNIGTTFCVKLTP